MKEREKLKGAKDEEVLSKQTLHKVVDILGSCSGHFTIVFFLKKWKFVWNVFSTYAQRILPHVGILQDQYSLLTCNPWMLLVKLILLNLQKTQTQ